MHINAIHKKLLVPNMSPRSYEGLRIISESLETSRATEQATIDAVSKYLDHLRRNQFTPTEKLIHRMQKRGIISPTENITPQELHDNLFVFKDNQLFSVKKSHALVAEAMACQSIKSTAREDLATGRRYKYGQIIADGFITPRVRLGDLVIGTKSTRPELRTYECSKHNWEKLIGLTVEAGWENVGKFQTETYLPAQIIKTEFEGDITLHQCLAWSKQKIRNSCLSSGKVDLEHMWIGTNGTVHNITAQRHTALSGIKTRTKNKIIGTIWDD